MAKGNGKRKRVGWYGCVLTTSPPLCHDDLNDIGFAIAISKAWMNCPYSQKTQTPLMKYRTTPSPDFQKQI